MGTYGGWRFIPRLFLRIPCEWTLGNALFKLRCAHGTGLLGESDCRPRFHMPMKRRIMSLRAYVVKQSPSRLITLLDARGLFNGRLLFEDSQRHDYHNSPLNAPPVVAAGVDFRQRKSRYTLITIAAKIVNTPRRIVSFQMSHQELISAFSGFAVS